MITGWPTATMLNSTSQGELNLSWLHSGPSESHLSSADLKGTTFQRVNSGVTSLVAKGKQGT